MFFDHPVQAIVCRFRISNFLGRIFGEIDVNLCLLPYSPNALLLIYLAFSLNALNSLSAFGDEFLFSLE
jgi:hypothetical protein